MDRVNDDPQLNAVWRRSTPGAPTDVEVMTRDRLPGQSDVQSAELAEQIRKQDAELLRKGLSEAGISGETITKLKIFDGLANNSGRFLVNSLDLSHRMMVYLNVSLLERAEKIKKDYLDDETLPTELKIEWQKAYNEIVDIIGKGYDRTLNGTQAMAKMMAANKDKAEGGKKGKPAFSPLKANDAR